MELDITALDLFPVEEAALAACTETCTHTCTGRTCEWTSML
ncbi:hypothetical protein ACFQ08_39700 [Streptosporangium algeriense]|uniref:FxLD family lantipeptide n=1 Tax=Streptosporangium algeriense TaxID=1682748 RepID=A0ABW3E765_9ACTN